MHTATRDDPQNGAEGSKILDTNRAPPRGKSFFGHGKEQDAHCILQLNVDQLNQILNLFFQCLEPFFIIVPIFQVFIGDVHRGENRHIQ